MEGVKSAVMINMFGQNFDQTSQEDGESLGSRQPAMMQLHNLTIRDVVVRGARTCGKIMCGNDTHACDGVTMTNVSMEDFGAGWQCVGEMAGLARDCSPQPCFTARLGDPMLETR